MFLPITTPGMDAMLKPLTSKGQVGDSVRQCSPTWAKTEGIDVARCGSLASMACPVAVREPATAQELEPVSAPSSGEPRTSGIAELILLAEISAGRAASS